MASRDFKQPRSCHVEGVDIGVSFTTDGGSAVATQNSGANWCTVTKPAGTGIYRLTFADTYQAVLACNASAMYASGTKDVKVDPVAYTNEASSTPLVVDVQVRKSSDGTALDPAAATITVRLLLRNSTVNL